MKSEQKKQNAANYIKFAKKSNKKLFLLFQVNIMGLLSSGNIFLSFILILSLLIYLFHWNLEWIQKKNLLRVAIDLCLFQTINHQIFFFFHIFHHPIFQSEKYNTIIDAKSEQTPTQTMTNSKLLFVCLFRISLDWRTVIKIQNKIKCKKKKREVAIMTNKSFSKMDQKVLAQNIQNSFE